jgi:hypothetical protein
MEIENVAQDQRSNESEPDMPAMILSYGTDVFTSVLMPVGETVEVILHLSGDSGQVHHIFGVTSEAGVCRWRSVTTAVGSAAGCGVAASTSHQDHSEIIKPRSIYLHVFHLLFSTSVKF